MPNVSIWEILLLLLVLLLVFGPKRLPEMGRSLGRGMREFKDSVSGNAKDDEPEKVELTPPVAAATTTPPGTPAPTVAAPAPGAETAPAAAPAEPESVSR